jgi:hypothetical protein
VQCCVEGFYLANARRCRGQDLPGPHRIGRVRSALDAASDMASEIPGGESAGSEQDGQQTAEKHERAPERQLQHDEDRERGERHDAEERNRYQCRAQAELVLQELLASSR